MKLICLEVSFKILFPLRWTLGPALMQSTPSLGRIQTEGMVAIVEEAWEHHQRSVEWRELKGGVSREEGIFRAD